MGLFRLTYGNGDSTHPVWSPDAGTIAYCYHQDEKNDGIYLVNEDGSSKQKIASGRVANPSWSPCGGLLLFIRKEGRFQYAVVLMNLEERREKTLARLATTSSMQPSFSADGAWAVFWGSEEEGAPRQQNIYKSELATGETKPLSEGEGSCSGAALSPNGQWLAFMRNTRQHHYRLSVYNMVAQDEAALGEELYSFVPPTWPVRWAPDGLELAYLQDGEIYLLRISDARSRRLTRPLEEQSRQQLAGSNKKLVFISNQPGGVKSMMSDDSTIILADRVVRAGQPFWSPDGLEVAYVRDETVYLAKPGKGAGRRISRGTVTDDHLAWSADGQRLVYVGEREY